MTEVHRYKVVKMLSESGSRISYDPHGPEVVTAEAYDQLKAENEALRSLVLSALEEGKGRPGSGGNAPGHCHDVPGVWDRGNGDRSGTPCGWCRIWNAAQAMAKEVSHG